MDTNKELLMVQGKSILKQGPTEPIHSPRILELLRENNQRKKEQNGYLDDEEIKRIRQKRKSLSNPL
jgi:hypothetical protein